MGGTWVGGMPPKPGPQICRSNRALAKKVADPTGSSDGGAAGRTKVTDPETINHVKL